MNGGQGVDSFSIGAVLKVLSEFGPVGLVILMWYFSDKRLSAVIEMHRKEITDVQRQAAADMAELREMYKSNASLCRDFSSVAADLREIVIMNIEKITNLDAAVRQNQYCPGVRLDKKQIFVREP